MVLPLPILQHIVCAKPFLAAWCQAKKNEQDARYSINQENKIHSHYLTLLFPFLVC